MQGLQLRPDEGNMLEELQGLVHRHAEDIGDAPILVLDLQGLAIIPLALADLAGHIDVR